MLPRADSIYIAHKHQHYVTTDLLSDSKKRCSSHRNPSSLPQIFVVACDEQFILLYKHQPGPDSASAGNRSYPVIKCSHCQHSHLNQIIPCIMKVFEIQGRHCHSLSIIPWLRAHTYHPVILYCAEHVAVGSYMLAAIWDTWSKTNYAQPLVWFVCKLTTCVVSGSYEFKHPPQTESQSLMAAYTYIFHHPLCCLYLCCLRLPRRWT